MSWAKFHVRTLQSFGINILNHIRTKKKTLYKDELISYQTKRAQRELPIDLYSYSKVYSKK